MAHRGRSECDAVAFEAANLRDTVTVCLCGHRHRTSGHDWPATRAVVADVTCTEKADLGWYQSSAGPRQSFCQSCGSGPFYQPIGANHLGIAAGCLDLPAGMAPAMHIFTADAGVFAPDRMMRRTSPTREGERYG